jgi:hypothetical protein
MPKPAYKCEARVLGDVVRRSVVSQDRTHSEELAYRVGIIGMLLRMDSDARHEMRQPAQAHKTNLNAKTTTPGVEPGLSLPQRDVLTTRRCGLYKHS